MEKRRGGEKREEKAQQQEEEVTKIIAEYREYKSRIEKVENKREGKKCRK